MYRYKYREIVGINDMLMECSWNTRDMMWEALAAIFPTMTGNGFCCTHSNHDPGDDLWGMIYGMGFTTLVIFMGVLMGVTIS